MGYVVSVPPATPKKFYTLVLYINVPGHLHDPDSKRFVVNGADDFVRYGVIIFVDDDLEHNRRGVL